MKVGICMRNPGNEGQMENLLERIKQSKIILLIQKSLTRKKYLN